MENDKMQVTALDFSYAINKAYERGISQGRLGNVGQLSFDEVMRQNPGMWAEHDRRINKAVATARAKWEASLDVHTKLDPVPSDAEEHGDE